MAHSVAELQAENVAYQLECIDRMYLNAYVPKLTSAEGVAAYFRFHKGRRFASTKDVIGGLSRVCPAIGGVIGGLSHSSCPTFAVA